eukprot:sb/3477153/
MRGRDWPARESEGEREQGILFEFETGRTVSLASEALTSRSNAASQWEKDVPRDMSRVFDNASCDSPCYNSPLGRHGYIISKNKNSVNGRNIEKFGYVMVAQTISSVCSKN